MRDGSPVGDDPWAYIPQNLRTRHDLRCRSIPNALRVTAAQYPEAEALVGEDGRRTFAELNTDMLTAVRAVMALGVRPGDRVGVWAPNCGRWVIAALGILGAGAVLVPVNTRFKGEEAAFVLRKSGARLLFVADGFLGNNYVDMLRRADPAAPTLGPGASVNLFDAGEPNEPTGSLSWLEFLAHASAVSVDDASAAIDLLAPDTMSDIMFTSGTTGHPKGVMLTHGQSLRAHGFFASMLGLRPGGRFLIIPPFFHTFGYKSGWMACLVHGVTIVPQATFDVLEVMQRIEQERITVLYGPPTIFQAIMDSPRRAEFDLSSIRNVLASATVVPPALLRRIVREFEPETLGGGYGLTEATSLITTSIPGDSIERLVTTVGRPTLDVEVRVVDDDGVDVPVDVEGEILTRGFNVMSGYWEEPERTAEAIDQAGWLHTGDIGAQDEAGYLRITDRKKDMILVGGFNVYPAEVERILGEHPAIDSIAVVSAPDERLGEVPVAFVVRREGAQLSEHEFLAWSAARIANFKCPRRMIDVAELPRNASMKVLKAELRERVRELPPVPSATVAHH